ncbi:hypothetical protein JCM21900_001666 [Sporobolomyces salmonicolor]
MLWSLALAALGASIAATAPVSSAPSVTTTYGTWHGSRADNVESFKGIPFALPPVGSLRFAPPVADDRPHGSFDATHFGYSCGQTSEIVGVAPSLQGGLLGGLTNNVEFNSSEDCLTLNVFRPAGIKSSSKLPVLAWIYGGGFMFGNTSQFDPTPILSQSVSLEMPVIYVSMNYRLNSFGYLPGAEAAADPSTSVNAGLMDQRLALEWIQQNIAAFGGDSEKVTIFGESAGAWSVSLQMLAYGGNITSSTTGKPLFRAAIAQSGAPIATGPTSYGQNSFDALTKATNCSHAANKISCLRKVPFREFLDATNTFGSIFSTLSLAIPFQPRTDGDFIPDLPQNLVAQHRYAKVPLISGNQYDEGTLFSISLDNITTSREVAEYFSNVWFPHAPKVDVAGLLRYYPENPAAGSPFDTGTSYATTPQIKRLNALIGDLSFQAGRRAFVGTTNATQPTWSYSSRVLRGESSLGSYHSTDLGSVYGTNPAPPAAEMQSRWIAFANHLDPNIAGYPFWPKYGNNATLLQFVSNSSSTIVSDTFRSAGLAYIWRKINSFTN